MRGRNSLFLTGLVSVSAVLMLSITTFFEPFASEASIKGAMTETGQELNSDQVDAVFSKQYKENSLLIKVRGKAQINSLKKKYGFSNIKKIQGSQDEKNEIYEVSFQDKDIKGLYSKIYTENETLYAQPNYKVSIDISPNDTLISNLWAMTKLHMPSAWDISTGSSSVVVAVLDTGVDYTHPDLASNIWINSDDPVNGVDDDDNGYIDDYYGFDYVNGTYNNQTGDWTNDADGPMDEDGHGTHVSGTTAGIGNNAQGVAGITWSSKIMALRFIGNDGGYTSDATAGIYYAINNGANVINCSWGGDGEDLLLKAAMDYAYNTKNVLVVAASGNDNVNLNQNPSYPAVWSSVVTVAATDSSDVKASFSNYGTQIDVSAPGVNIASTLPDDQYGYGSGTSMAAPHVSGLAALILAKNPTWTNKQIELAIKRTAVDLGGSGYDTSFGYGRIDGLAPLEIINPPTPISLTNSEITVSTNPQVVGNAVIVSITIKDEDDNPVPNHTLEISSSSDLIITQPTGVTDANGQTSGSLITNYSGVKTFGVTDKTENLVLNNNLIVTYNPAEFSQITTALNKNRIMTYTKNYILMTIQCVDLFDNIVPGARPVSISGLRSGDSVWINETTPFVNGTSTDSSGQLILRIKSSNMGTLNLEYSIEGFNTSRSVLVVRTGDLNGDASIDGLDASVLVNSWERLTNLNADINCDNIVDGLDASLLVFNWSD